MQLRKIRKAKNFSQKYLANKLHVTQQSVAKWEIGQSFPRAETLLKISKILDCSVDELLCNDSTNKE